MGGPLARTATDLAIGLDATIGPDPADAATRVLEGRHLPRFVDALDATALSGARLGELTAYFGDTPEDGESGRVVRQAIEQMKEAGAEIVEIEIPGLDSLVRGSSVITYEFKWDFIDYLAATPGAPVSSIQDILDRGLHHTDLESRYRRRNEVATRNSEEYRAALAKHAVVRDAVVAVLEEHQLDALIYPTLRRKPARIDDPQRGSACQLSASSGLPALSMPVGFTADSLPAGAELLGLPFSDARLLALGYAFEQATNHRRAPHTTPPLVAGRAPEPRRYDVNAEGGGATVRARFSFDVSTGVLSYEVNVSGVAAADIHAVNLHRAASGDVGPVIYRLAAPGQQTSSGTYVLKAVERDALLAGRVYLTVYTEDDPGGAARGQLVSGSRERE